MPPLNAKLLVDKYSEAYGNKSANLMVMKEFFTVPDIHPLSHNLCLNHLNKYNQNWQLILDEFKQKQGNDQGGLVNGTHEILERLRASIRETFIRFPLDDDGIVDYLTNHFESNDVLMVRSTGKEDSAELANPGGNESYAGIEADIKSVSIACGNVIASYFSEKSLEQRLKSQQDSESILSEPFMPVLLQKMVGEIIKEQGQSIEKIIYSGVMYVDKEDKVTIQEAPGFGELVVNSKGPVNTYFVLGDNTVHQQICEKPFRLASYINKMNQSELIVQKNSRAVRNSFLPGNVIERLSKLGKEIQAFYDDDRDIEFVYDQTIDKLYIVQARPIPFGESVKHIPRAIAPEQIRDIKAKAPHYKGKTIAVAASRAEIVQNADEVLICNTVGDALTQYLDMKEPKIKAVIVTTDAPGTSHEAAMFNSVSIPVFYVNKTQQNSIKSTLEQGNKKCIFDPQRGLIVEWPDRGNPENILKEGLFKSSISAERTLLPESEMIFKENSIQQIESFLKDAKKKTDMTYDDLLDQLEIIESTTPETVLQSKEALRQILMDIVDACRVGAEISTQQEEELKSNILKHAIAYSLDVDNLLSTIVKADGNIISNKQQKRLLDLVNGLEALIANPGRKGMYSDSVYNLMQHHVLKKKLQEKYPIYAHLPEENRNVVEAVSQFGKYAATHQIQNTWERFVVQIAMADRGSKENNLKKLASIIYYAEANELGSVLMNNVFNELDVRNFSETINELDAQMNQLQPYSKRIFDLEVKSAELEAKSILWSRKKNHARMIKEYKKDVAEVLLCIDSFGPLHVLPLMAKTKVLGEIARITETIDASIKIMKSSQDYANEDSASKIEQAKLFYNMLIPYHSLMQKVVENMDDSEKNKDVHVAAKGSFAYQRSGRAENTTPAERSLRIKERFELFDSKNITREQLFTSGKFSVMNATILSKDVYDSSFTRVEMTLEDFYTLFHQNIVSALSNMQSGQLPKRLYPAKVNIFLDEIKNASTGCFKNGLMPTIADSRIKEGNVLIQLNVPLGTHAASVKINYNINTSDVEINYDFPLMGANNYLKAASNFYRKLPEALGMNISSFGPYGVSICFKMDSDKENDRSVFLARVFAFACAFTVSETLYHDLDWILMGINDPNLKKIDAALIMLLLTEEEHEKSRLILSLMGYISNSGEEISQSDIEEAINRQGDSKNQLQNDIELWYQSLGLGEKKFNAILEEIKNPEFTEILTISFFEHGMVCKEDDLKKILNNHEKFDRLLFNLIDKESFANLEKIITDFPLDKKILSDIITRVLNVKYTSPELLSCISELGKKGAIPEFKNLEGISTSMSAEKLSVLSFKKFEGTRTEILTKRLSVLLDNYDSFHIGEFILKADNSSELDWDRSIILDLFNLGKINLKNTIYTPEFMYENFKSYLVEVCEIIEHNNVHLFKKFAADEFSRKIMVKYQNELFQLIAKNNRHEMGIVFLDSVDINIMESKIDAEIKKITCHKYDVVNDSTVMFLIKLIERKKTHFTDDEISEIFSSTQAEFFKGPFQLTLKYIPDVYWSEHKRLALAWVVKAIKANAIEMAARLISVSGLEPNDFVLTFKELYLKKENYSANSDLIDHLVEYLDQKHINVILNWLLSTNRIDAFLDFIKYRGVTETLMENRALRETFDLMSIPEFANMINDQYKNDKKVITLEDKTSSESKETPEKTDGKIHSSDSKSPLFFSGSAQQENTVKEKESAQQKENDSLAQKKN
ncbi:MAG: PEP/pyruvate-binding domain-containing protein [Tatlockia sp.]|jgi:hypothetical protein